MTAPTVAQTRREHEPNMTHTPDHREDIRSAIRQWLREDVRIAGKLSILSYENALIEKIVKAVEKQEDKKA